MAIAFQIRDDLLNLMSTEDDAAQAPGLAAGAYGKERGGDVAEGKRTLIVIDLLRKCSGDERRRVLGILHTTREETTPEQIETVIGMAADRGSIAYASEVADRRGQEALELLEELPATEERELLREMLEFFVHRAY